MLPDPLIATNADYADALITARRAKNLLILLLLLMVLGQLALFFTARFTNLVIPGPIPSVNDVTAAAATQSVASDWVNQLRYLVGLTQFLGMALSFVLTGVLLLTVLMAIVRQLVGVGRLTSAFVWSLLLIVLLFPWQAFLNNAGMTLTEFKVPGILYTWPELVKTAKFANDAPLPYVVLKWARFVAFPLIAVIILLAVQVKSNRGLRQALGGDIDDVLPPTHEV
jgi:hypothetical protein